MEISNYFPPTEKKLTRANADMKRLRSNHDEQSLRFLQDILMTAKSISIAKQDIAGAEAYNQIISIIIPTIEEVRNTNLFLANNG